MIAADWPILVPLVVGHIALFVLCLNLLHSTAVSDGVLSALNWTLLLATLIALPVMLTQGHWSTWPQPARGYALVCLAVALVGLPAVTLIRAFRRPPTEVAATRSQILDLRRTLGDDRTIGAGDHHWLLKIPGNWSLQVSKVEHDLRLPQLPPALDGLTIVQISDTHFARCYHRDFFEAIAAEAASWDADLVVFTGDLLDDVATLDWVEPFFAQLRGRLGQFAILGNHDHRLRPGKARRSLRNAGFVDLEGRWAEIDVRHGNSPGGRIALGGTSEPWGPKLDYDAMPEADFRIVLSHSPDQFPKASGKGVDFVVAGHNHGGQIRIPGFGPILMPSRYSRHFDRGFFRANDSVLYVSQGLGGKHPIRIGTHPEITRFTLHATVSPAATSPQARPTATHQPHAIASLANEC